jgi:hypothetical protein
MVDYQELTLRDLYSLLWLISEVILISINRAFPSM